VEEGIAEYGWRKHKHKDDEGTPCCKYVSNMELGAVDKLYATRPSSLVLSEGV
jgi:hypothetical protein